MSLPDDDDKPLPPPLAKPPSNDLGYPIATATLAQKRVSGTGPEYLKAGRRISYRPSACRRWKTNKPMS